MDRSLLRRCSLFLLPLLLSAQQWQKKTPAEMGLDAAKLQEAVDYAQANGSTWDFDKDQIR